MLELPLPYINELAKQLAFISSFLGGFSVTFLGALILSDKEGRLMRSIIVSTAVSAFAFIITVMAMTQLIMVSTEGYPFKIEQGDLSTSRVIGTLTFMFGVLSLLLTIGLSGWLKSRRLGLITSILGGLTLIIFFLLS